MKRLRDIIGEDVPANNAGSGNVAGIGVGPQGEPGGIKNLLLRMLRRRKTDASKARKAAPNV